MSKLSWPTAATIVGTVAGLVCVAIFADPDVAKPLMLSVGGVGVAVAGYLNSLVKQ